MITNTTSASPSASATAAPIIFFNAKSTSNTSPSFLVDKEPFYISAFNLADGDSIAVQQVAGPGSGTIFSPFAPSGVGLALSNTQTGLRIDWPGHYRLVFSGASVAAIQVQGFAGTMTEQTTYGLSAANGGSGGGPIAIEGNAPIVVTGAGATSDPFEISLAGQSGSPPSDPPDGSDSIYIGPHAGLGATGVTNIFIGVQAGISTTGEGNVFLGSQAGDNAGAVNNAVFVGTAAGSGSSFTNPAVAIGAGAGSSATGSGIFLGPGAGANNTFANVIVIDQGGPGEVSAVADNYCMLGDDSITHTVTAGSIISAGAVSASDSRLKKHVKPINFAAATLSLLNPVEFYWDEERVKASGLPFVEAEFAKHQTGVLAQEIERHIPWVVEEIPGKDGEVYKHVRYDRLIPLLLAGFKEQEERLQMLESRLATVENSHAR